MAGRNVLPLEDSPSRKQRLSCLRPERPGRPPRLGAAAIGRRRPGRFPAKVTFMAARPQFLNPLFTVTRKKSGSEGRRAARQFDCLFTGTRGEAEGRMCRAGGRKPDLSMNSRVSWSVDGIDPSVPRKRARGRPRARAGMSLSDWLNSHHWRIPPPRIFAAPQSQPPVAPSQESRDGRRYPSAAGFD